MKDKGTVTEKTFRQSIIISVFGLLLSMIALCSTTWAWFVADISSPANKIQSAFCDITVSVSNENSPIEAQNGRYFLEKGKSYKFKIAAAGTAESAYCILKINDTAYYTSQFPVLPVEREYVSPEDAFWFTLEFTESTEIEVITRWGTSGKTERAIGNRKHYKDLKEAS